MARYAQPIRFFFCRPCGEYHPKTHPHYAEDRQRRAERKRLKAEKAKNQGKPQHDQPNA